MNCTKNHPRRLDWFSLLDLFAMIAMNSRYLGFEAGRSVHPEEVAELRAFLEEVPGNFVEPSRTFELP